MPANSRLKTWVLVTAVALSACTSPKPGADAPAPGPPEGRHALAQARKALQETKQFTMIDSLTTNLGTFTTTINTDCEAPYFYYRRESALTPEGVAFHTTQLQGRANTSSVEERVFAGSRSLSRFTGTWESPAAGTGDARPNWEISQTSYDPATDCQAFARGNMTALPFGKMLAATKTAYVGQQVVGGYACHEYTVTYSDQVLDETMTESEDGKSAVRGETTRPVEGTLCIAEDDWLPLRAVLPASSGRPASTLELVYEPFVKIQVRLPYEFPRSP